MELNVTQVCQQCSGAKVYETTSDAGIVVVDPCPTCLGEGSIVLFTINAVKLKKRFDDIDKDLKDIKDHLGI